MPDKDLKKFIDDALKWHNKYRKEHGVSELKHKKDISEIAQKWADHLAKNNTFQHAPQDGRKFKGDTMGENIAMKYTSSGDAFTGEQATDQWYEEISKFDFARSSGGGTGHFTQIVWKSSKEFGIGKAQTSDGKWIVVANYHPAGNLMGTYAENVTPRKDGKIPPKKTPEPGFSRGAAAGPSTTSSMTKEFKSLRTTDGFDSFGDDLSSFPSRTTTTQQTTSSRVTSRQIKEETRNGVTKRIVTETTVEPDGTKKTTTEETIING